MRMVGTSSRVETQLSPAAFLVGDLVRVTVRSALGLIESLAYTVEGGRHNRCWTWPEWSLRVRRRQW